MPLQLIDLLGKGYFPRELPPPFTTVSFSQALARPGTQPSGAFNSSPKFSMMGVHNLVRTGGLRRNLGIPNPKHFFRLAQHIVAHWHRLKALAYASPFSLSKPVDGRSDRSVS